MDLLVVKSTNFSIDDIAAMGQSVNKTLRVIFITPSGMTLNVDTDVETFLTRDADNNDSVIYGDEYLQSLIWDNDRCL